MKPRVSLLLLPLALAACARAAEPAPSPAPRTAGPPVTSSVARPLPLPIEYPAGYERAIAAGTRTEDGRPGDRYWQQWAEYDVAVTVDPARKRVDGTTRIVYQNRSPRTLPQLWLELAQNLHAPGAPRLEEVEVTEGVELRRVAVGGTELRPLDGGDVQRPAYEVHGTRMVIHLAQPLAPGASVTLDFAFAYTIPQAGAGGRMGHDSENLIYLAYFHPRMHVFDDVTGWMVDPFLGPGEFYHGFGNYRYTVDAPAGWLVVGTGDLLNPQETLSDDVLERLRRAERSDEIVQVVAAAQASRATKAGRNGRLVWRFEADSVRDIAVSLTRESNWDAARTPVGDRDGDGDVDYARADAIWRTTAPRWQHAARYTQHAIDFLSRYTATPYPWPHMTSVEASGIIGGGMEYPQMTIIGDYNEASDADLYAVVAHELAHMWVPMIVSTNERRYGWLDEGTTSFNETQARVEFLQDSAAERGELNTYLQFAGGELEGEMMRWTDYHVPGPGMFVASYPKPSSALLMLREVLGVETFDRAYHEFFDRWAFRQAYPWDLWNTFEDVSGRDLDWFWYPWYYTTWTLDQAVGSVTREANGSARITIKDQGRIPMPARVRVTRADGSTLDREVPVDTWLSGATSATIDVPAGAAVLRVEIDAEQAFADADRANNVWARGN
ncbi:MAG TPA: M1 family metallopeptidase [Longimicrobiales bacterium]